MLFKFDCAIFFPNSSGDFAIRGERRVHRGILSFAFFMYEFSYFFPFYFLSFALTFPLSYCIPESVKLKKDFLTYV